jgi:hypothetical protein
MEIKTKYNFKDKLWVMKNNKPMETFIEQINTHSFYTENMALYDNELSLFRALFSQAGPGVVTTVSYELAYGCGTIGDNTPIYKTKEELLKNL